MRKCIDGALLIAMISGQAYVAALESGADGAHVPKTQSAFPSSTCAKEDAHRFSKHGHMA